MGRKRKPGRYDQDMNKAITSYHNRNETLTYNQNRTSTFPSVYDNTRHRRQRYDHDIWTSHGETDNEPEFRRQRNQYRNEIPTDRHFYGMSNTNDISIPEPIRQLLSRIWLLFVKLAVSKKFPGRKIITDFRKFEIELSVFRSLDPTCPFEIMSLQLFEPDSIFLGYLDGRFPFCGRHILLKDTNGVVLVFEKNFWGNVEVNNYVAIKSPRFVINTDNQIALRVMSSADISTINASWELLKTIFVMMGIILMFVIFFSVLAVISWNNNHKTSV